MIGFAVAVGYVAVVLWWARWLFGTWRARCIDGKWHETTEEAVESFKDVDRPFVMVGAFATALFWPVSLPLLVGAHFMARFLSATPVRSHREVAAEHDVMAKRIGELERELGIKEEQR